MQDLFAATVICVLGGVILTLVISRYRQRELNLLALAFAAHVAAGVAQVLITVGLYGDGDIFGYTKKGLEIAAALRLDFQDLSWELLKIVFHQEGILPISFAGIGSATGSMTAIAGFVLFFTGGGVYTGCILFAVAGFYGKLAMYEVFRLNYPEPLHRKLLVAALLVPSVVFWSSGLLKESVAMVGLGPVMLGVQRMLDRRPLSGIFLLAFGGVIIALIKAYILFAFVAASAVWVYAAIAWQGHIPRLRPVHLILGLVVGVVALTVLGRIFPQYALDVIADQAAYRQEVGQRYRGGSTYELVTPGADASMSTQLAYAPLALFTALYRPLVFEARSIQVLVNALETTGFLALTLLALWRVKLRTIWVAIISSPFALYSLAFVVVFGVAVGLTTTNLGTLSRYRMPLVPLLASLLVTIFSAKPPVVVSPNPPALPLRRNLRPGPARTRPPSIPRLSQ